MNGEPLMEPHFASADECRTCPYAMPCVSQPSGANLRIAPRTVFDCIFSGSTLSGSISTLLTSVEQQVRNAADARFGAGSGSRLSGGMNNARGEWLEYALKVIFWNSAVEHGNGNTVIVKLPNAAQLQFSEHQNIFLINRCSRFSHFGQAFGRELSVVADLQSDSQRIH